VPRGGGAASPKISPAPLPAPSSHRNNGPAAGLRLTVRADDVRPLAGTSVRFTLIWKDGTGYYAGSSLRWGDESQEGGSVNTKPCTGDAPQSGASMTASHTFHRPGRYTVQLSVSTCTCDSRTETQTVPMTITVAQPTPSPSAGPSASPSPAASEPVAPPT
jgi:PKD repeat protein